MKLAVAALVLALGALLYGASADEMSGDDKLRMLYSHRFVFGKDGLPLVTVELMHGEKEVRLGADKGLAVYPDGEGGAKVSAGSKWRVTVRDGKPAKMRWWTIVSRQATDADIATWKARGYATQTFETGVVFGVEGDVVDSRELLLGIAPENDEAAAKKAAAALAERWDVPTFTHPEMTRRPSGTIVAEDDRGNRVENAGVLWFVPEGGADAMITVEDVLHGGGGSQRDAEKRDTRKYRGQIYVTLDREARLTVVNAISEDRLLAGLVPAEIFADAHPEALKAQAVAARVELLSKIGTRHHEDPFLLCSTQHCQVYSGAGAEDPRTTKAVAATRGEVLVRDGGGLVEAYYSASCGGFSEHNENVWARPPDPSLRGHLDATGAGAKALAKFAAGVTDDNVRAFLGAPPDKAYCGATRYAKNRYRWTVTKTASELDDLIRAEFPTLGSIKDIVPVERGVSGRIKKLKLVGTKGTTTVEGELRIRRLLGGLKSSLFVASRDGNTWTLSGAGFGHGVGMCQTGAIGMAEAGLTYKKILEHYYRGAHVAKLY